jgi:acetyl-CoA carboxylase/biotin carboxylase 1
LYKSIQDHLRNKDGPFPAEKLKDLIQSSSESGTCESLISLCTEFEKGSDEYEKNVIMEFIEKYLQVEEHFEHKGHEAAIMKLRDQNRTNLGDVVKISRAYVKSSRRCDLILALFDTFRDIYVQVGKDMPEWKLKFSRLVHRVANLNCRSAAKPSLRAKKMLVTYQTPTFEERYEATQKILAGAVVSNDDGIKSQQIPPLLYENVATLITAEHGILDVLPTFFYHYSVGIQAISMYTYVLYSSQAYTISAVKYENINGRVVFLWDFALRHIVNLPNQSPRALRKGPSHLVGVGGSFGNIISIFDMKAIRKGYMCVFDTLDDVTRDLQQVLESISISESDKNQSAYMMNIVNVCIKFYDNLLDDSNTASLLRDVVRKFESILRKHSFRRITFIIIREKHFPRYITFRENLNFDEDKVIRNIEPAMAYQLELQRLENFEIDPCFVDNRRLHIYKAVGKENTTDVRFFLRTLVFPGQILTPNLTPSQITEFIASEGNRVMHDALDALEIVSAAQPNTDCNHFFINFVPTLNLDLPTAEKALRELIDRHSKQLWTLRVTAGEVRFIIKSSPKESPRVVRFIITSPTGYTTKIECYQAARDSFGVDRLKSTTTPPGALHNHPVSFIYETKETIQPRRYKAHLMGTTYVYDYPDLFRRALEKTWLECQPDNSTAPNLVLIATELALDENKNIIPVYRPPGNVINPNIKASIIVV